METKQTELIVEGMTCQNCVRHVREALQGVAGVEAVEVELPGGRARVRHAPETVLAALVAAVEDAGYGSKAAA